MAKKTHEETSAYIASLVARARTAQAILNDYTQEQVDKLVAMIAYEMTRLPVRQALSDLALAETELGDIPSKLAKIETKVKGVYNDIKHEKTVGIVERDEAKGLVRIKKPAGVIGALIPSTQPEMIPITATEMGIKTRNATIFAPHPRAVKCTKLLVEMFRAELKKLGLPEDLVLGLEEVSNDLTSELMSAADMVVATGGMGMVKAAYSSGKPAIGVGQGNVQCIIDEDADIADAVGKIIIGRAFDNGLICLGEQTVFVPEDKEAEFVAEMKKQGGYLVEGEENVDKLREGLFPGGGAFSRVVVGMFADQVSDEIGLGAPKGTRVLFAKAKALGAGDVLCREKLCPVIAYMTYKTFKEGVAMMEANLDHEGKGHSIAVHSNTPENVEYAAIRCCVSRVVVNQPSGTTGGGSPTNGFTPTTTLGCGTWGNNSFAGNLNYEQFINITRVGYPFDESYLPDTDKAFED